MRRFLGSGWFPVVIALLMGGVATAAYAVLAPQGADVGNSEMVRVFTIGSWAVGGVMALLSMLLMGVLNLIRRICKIRRVEALHPVVVFAGTFPWFAFAWSLTGEPRFTAFARAMIDFVGRPMLWGSLIATLVVVLCSIPLVLPSKK